MWMFIIMIICGILGIISSFFPQGLSALTMYGLLFAGFFLALVSFILFILMLVEKKKRWIWYLLAVMLYVLYVFFLPNVYNFVRSYYLVGKHLKEFSVPGKIIGVHKKDYKFGDHDSCYYSFNVKLDDGENVVFQSGYCEVGTMWASYSTVDNYGYHYLSYYFDKYKKEHPNSLTLELKGDHFTAEPSAIHYSSSNRSDLCGFLRYLDDHSVGASYSIEIEGDDLDEFHILHSWNHFEIDMQCREGVEY